MTIKTISILGTGWLGLPLAEHFISIGNDIKASTTSKSRLQELLSLKIEPFILDIGRLPSNLGAFFQANILIINIPSKNIDDFNNLIKEIESSEIEKYYLLALPPFIKMKTKYYLSQILKIQQQIHC